MSVAAASPRGSAAERVRPTKVTLPELPASVVTETRASRLLAADRAPITVVVAPPGAGKSATLIAWIRSDPTLTDRAAWASLDRSDDDATSLWSTVLAALQSNPLLAADPRIVELSAAPAVAEVDEALVRQLGALIGAQDPPFLLVLDDLHELTSPDAMAAVELLCRLRPPSLELVLSGQSRPHPALERLGPENGVREIGPEDLQLGRQEAAALLTSLGHDLDAEAVEVLWRRTEGWVAGLRLAAAELHRGVDPWQLANTFGGTTPTVSELLVAEVIERLPEDVRAFLVATGGCRELTPSLAERLTGRGDAGTVLDDLHRRNTLTQRLTRDGGAEPVFRYHDLLRDFLAAELQRTDLRRWRRLQGVLADWYADQWQWTLALEHAVGSGDQVRVRTVLRAAGVGMILDGDGPLLERLLAEVPRAWRSDPVIGSLVAAAALARFDPVAADRALGAMRAMPPVDDDRSDDRWLSALRATIVLHRARFDREVGGALEAAEAEGVGATGDADLDLLGLIQTGVVRLRVDDAAGAREDLERALDLATGTTRDFPRAMCLGNLAALATIDGRVADLDDYLGTALDIARRRGWDGSQLTVQFHVLVAWWALLRGDRATAQREIAALPPPTSFGNPDMRVAGAAIMAIADHTDGVPARETASRLRATWDQLVGAQTTPQISCLLIPWEVKLWLVADDRVAAEEAARRRASDLEGTAEQLLVEVLLARADGASVSNARRRLAPARDGEVPVSNAVNRILVWLLEAQLAAEAGAMSDSDAALLQVVGLAAPDHLVGLVAAFGPSATKWLAVNRDRFGPHEAFVTEVMRAQAVGMSSGLDVELTTAEEAILRELPTHRTVADIAALRGVSVNTVKTHLKGIYRKLGVRDRRDAVAAARAQGLL